MLKFSLLGLYILRESKRETEYVGFDADQKQMWWLVFLCFFLIF